MFGGVVTLGVHLWYYFYVVYKMFYICIISIWSRHLFSLLPEWIQADREAHLRSEFCPVKICGVQRYSLLHETTLSTRRVVIPIVLEQHPVYQIATTKCADLQNLALLSEN